jgi:hypothetical protein
MLYGMYINGVEAWKFQNACRCHGNRKDTQFNTKVNNNLEKNGFNCLPSSTTSVMEMLEDYIISMKSNAKDVCHTLGCW